MAFLSANWLWLYAGVLLMLAEVVTPGFVVFFFGLAAATVGGLLFALPAGFELTLAWQLALFSLFSVIYLVTLRRYARALFVGDTAESAPSDPSFVGRTGRVTEAIRADVPGRVMLGDAEWSAVAAEAVEAGASVRVTARENLTLTVVRV